jgi:glycosyltransferase involved in cell wall biosynthesis
MRKQIFFSILVPSKNGEDYIGNVIKSILDQTFKNYEIIIGDNNNNVRFKKVINQFLPNKKIIYISHSSDLDVASSWNSCLNRASGKYMIMLGDDDCLLKNSLQKIYEIFNKYEYPEVLTTNAISFCEQGSMPYHKWHSYKKQFWDFKKYSLTNGLISHEDRKNILKKIFSLKNYLPLNMQPHIFSKSLSDKIKGGIFQLPTPDAYAIYAMLSEANNWAIFDYPMFSIGTSKKSFGYYWSNNKLDEGKNYLRSFTKKEYDFVPGSLLNDYLIIVLQKLKKNILKLSAYKINRSAYLARQLFRQFENLLKKNINSKVFFIYFKKLKNLDFFLLLLGLLDISLYKQAIKRLLLFSNYKERMHNQYTPISKKIKDVYEFTRAHNFKF